MGRALVPDVSVIDPRLLTTMPDGSTPPPGSTRSPTASRRSSRWPTARSPTTTRCRRSRWSHANLARTMDAPARPRGPHRMAQAALEAGLAFTNAILGRHARDEPPGRRHARPAARRRQRGAAAARHPVQRRRGARAVRPDRAGHGPGGRGGRARPRRPSSGWPRRCAGWATRSGCRKGLGDLGVTGEDIPRLAQLTLGDACLTTNPRPASVTDVDDAVPGGPVVTTPTASRPSRGRAGECGPAARRRPPRPRGPHRPALRQAALLPRVPHLRRAAAPGDPGAGADLGRAGAHHRGLRGAGARRRRGRGGAPLRATGWCSPWSTASCPTPARATSCAVPDGAQWTDADARLPDEVARAPAGRRPRAPPTTTHGHDAEAHRRHVHVPVRLDGRVVGGFVAWTPPSREIDDTDRSVLRHPRRPDRGGAAELRAARPLGPAATPGAPARPTPWPGAQRPSCRRRRPSSAPRASARCSTPSGTASRASSTTASPSTRSRPGMHIELARIGDRRPPAARPTSTPPRTSPGAPSSSCGRRSTRCNHGDGARPTRTCRRCCAGSRACTCPDELRVEVRIGGEPVPLSARVRAVAVPDRGRGAVQHRRARRGERGRWCGWRTAAAGSG